MTYVSVGNDLSGAVAMVKALARADVIIDATIPNDRIELFLETVWALRDGGKYVNLLGGRRWAEKVQSHRSAFDRGSVAARRRRQELIDSTSMPTKLGHSYVVDKKHNHHAVVRHPEVEHVLVERVGESWGSVLARQPAYEYESRAELVMHGEPAAGDKPRIISVPELSVREYHDATCHLREIVTCDNLLLPDSYRHWQNKNLFHKRIQPASQSFGRLIGEAARTQVSREEGVYFSFDSAFPSHFGHLMTETISRFWGWRHAVRSYPDLRPVVTHQSGRPALPGWKADVLKALDIPIDRILWVQEGKSIQVDTLVSAMPQLVNPRYIDANIRDTWAQIATGIGRSELPRRTPEKIFLSRRRQSQRACSNTAEVEALFESLGFEVVLPEELSFGEQVNLFQGAKIIAGVGGSALFNAMFNPQAKIIVLTSRSYVAANEYLIASANGNEIHYFWAPPAIEHPSGKFSTDAYRSGFEFPIDEHLAALRKTAA